MSVTLRAEERDDDCASVELVITDTGIGMSDQFLVSDLFTPYKQADSNSVGTGLGLSIVKQIVKDMNGQLSIQSKLQQGTKVSVTLDTELFQRDVQSMDADLDFRTQLASVDIQQFHLLTVDNNIGLSQNQATEALGLSVCKTAAEWLQCAITTGPRCDKLLRRGVCAVAEDDLVRLGKLQPAVLSAVMAALSREEAQLIVIVSNFRSRSLCFKEYNVQPLFLQQP